jgi:hypothetical protein
LILIRRSLGPGAILKVVAAGVIPLERALTAAGPPRNPVTGVVAMPPLATAVAGSPVTVPGPPDAWKEIPPELELTRFSPVSRTSTVRMRLWPDGRSALLLVKERWSALPGTTVNAVVAGARPLDVA